MLVNELDSGGVKVIDLTQPLSFQAPVIGLPPPFASSPGSRREGISRYDNKGPAWYGRLLHLGEHTGTHFDAPNHWGTDDQQLKGGDAFKAKSCLRPWVQPVNAEPTPN